MTQKIATAVEKSGNKKLGDASATSAAQVSCPPDCPFFEDGCYAENGPQGWTTARLNKAAEAMEASAMDAAHAEAEAIRSLSGKRDLRLHVVGDCRTAEAARTVAAAAEEHKAKHGKAAWTYTHASADVPREAWGSVSVLASCESPADIPAARQRGYATALVVAKFASDKAYTLAGERVIPCPEMTGRASGCTDCRLCFDDARLRSARLTIAFEAHGQKVKAVTSKLITIGGAQ